MSYPESYRKHSVEIYFEIPSHSIGLAAESLAVLKHDLPNIYIQRRCCNYTSSGTAGFWGKHSFNPLCLLVHIWRGREAFARNLEGLGHAILGNLSTDQMAMELT